MKTEIPMDEIFRRYNEMLACLEMFVMEHKAGMTPTRATIAEARAIIRRIKGEA